MTLDKVTAHHSKLLTEKALRTVGNIRRRRFLER
jgi:hypothetical protein